MPFGPASSGLIRTFWKRISSTPIPGVVAMAVALIFANARVSSIVLRVLPPPPPLTTATPVPVAETSLSTPFCANLIACVPWNSSLSARAGAASAAPAAITASATQPENLPMPELCPWKFVKSIEFRRWARSRARG